MAAVIPNQGQQFHAKASFKGGHGLRIWLFTNNVTPDANSVIGDFTKATATGLQQRILADGDWNVDAGGEVTAADQDFSNTSGGDVPVYGWGMSALDPEDGVTEMLVAVERDPNAPVTVPDGGVPYRVSPSGTTSQGPSS